MSEIRDIPEHWEVKNLSDFISNDGIFCDGDWIESKDQDENGEVRLIQLADIRDGYFRDKSNRYLTLKRANELNCTFLKQGDILVARMPEPLGRCCLFPLIGNNKFVTVVDVAIIRVNDEICDKRFLSYAINTPQIRNAINKLESGTTRKRISRKNLNTIDFPLPPLSEQQAIVAKIEELLSELDNSKQQLQTALQQLKVYRQSLLKWVFEGKLTHKNVKEGELPDGWQNATIGDIFEVHIGSTPKRNNPNYWGGNINWLSSGEIAFRDIKSTREQITVEGLENTSCKVHPIGTVIIAMIGEGKTRGQAAILKIESSHNQNTAAIRVDDQVYKSQLLYYYLVLKYEDNRRVGSGNNQKALNKERVKNISIPLPPISEQQLIVDELESKLTLCDNVEETIKLSLQQAETLRQSILKKAFEGKLV